MAVYGDMTEKEAAEYDRRHSSSKGLDSAVEKPDGKPEPQA